MELAKGCVILHHLLRYKKVHTLIVKINFDTIFLSGTKKQTRLQMINPG